MDVVKLACSWGTKLVHRYVPARAAHRSRGTSLGPCFGVSRREMWARKLPLLKHIKTNLVFFETAQFSSINKIGHANESDWNLKILGLLSMARRAQQINGGSARSKCFPSCGRYSTTIVRSTCQVQLPNFLTPCPARHLCNGTGDAYLCSYSLSYSLQMQLQLAPQGVPLKFGVQLILSGKQATWPGCSKSSQCLGFEGTL